jgi:hypothetical protein
MKTNGTRVIWLNRLGKQWEHNFGYRCTLSYARDWWRRSILECQGILSRDERRESQLRLVEIQNTCD